MTDRESLRAAGARIRAELNIADEAGQELAPGFGKLADELAFGKVWARPGLRMNERMLATLSALTSRQYLPQLATYVEAALHIGMPAEAIQEVMIHCSLYSGLSTAENSLEVVGQILEETGTPVPHIEGPELDLDALMTQGLDTMKALHQDRAEQAYAAPDAGAPTALYPTAIQYGYGTIWNRPGLTRRERMICSVAAFTAIEAPTQRHKFYRSALNVGLSREEIIEVIVQTGPYSGFPRALNALLIAEEVLS